MRIGEFAQASGLSIDTLRYYDKIGLLRPEKTNRLRRYSKADLKKAKEITKMKTMNFSLTEMKRVFDLDREMERGLKVGIVNNDIAIEGLELLELKYKEIILHELQIKEVKKQLEHLIIKMKNFIQEGFRDDE